MTATAPASGSGTLRAPLIPVDTLDRGHSYPVRLRPSPQTAAAIAGELGLDGIAGLALDGTLAPEGAGGWRLEARLTARVGQTCVVTLEPLENRIDEPVARVWLPADAIAPAGTDLDPDAPDAPDPLGAAIDLGAVVREALALAIDPWPRAPGAKPVAQSFGPAAAESPDDARAQPFAALAALRARMGRDDD